MLIVVELKYMYLYCKWQEKKKSFFIALSMFRLSIFDDRTNFMTDDKEPFVLVDCKCWHIPIYGEVACHHHQHQHGSDIT